MEFNAGNALRPDLVLLPLDDEFVAFSETSQTLIGLNATANEIVTALKAGKPTADILRDLTSRGASGREQAEEWLRGIVDALRSAGLLADSPVPRPNSDQEKLLPLPPHMPPYSVFKPAVERRYRLLNTCALVRFQDPIQSRMVDSVIGHLATNDNTPATLTIDIPGARWEADQFESFIYRNCQPVSYAGRLSFLGPMIKSMLWSAAIDAHPFLFYIHAGVVGLGSNTVLFPAAAGSGKSSLTAAMVSKGFRYFSDEVALVETLDFDVQPMPLAFCAKRSGWDVMARYFPQIANVPTHRRADGKDVRYVPPPVDRVQHTSGRVSHIIFPKYQTGEDTRLTAVSRADALRRLMEECLALRTALTVQNVRKLIATLSQIDCYALTFSSLDEAVELVSEAVGVRQSMAVNYR
jgi:hypothetical protein